MRSKLFHHFRLEFAVFAVNLNSSLGLLWEFVSGTPKTNDFIQGTPPSSLFPSSVWCIQKSILIDI